MRTDMHEGHAGALAEGVGRVADDVRGLRRPEAGWRAGIALFGRSMARSWRPLAAVCAILMMLEIVLVLNASAQLQAQSFSRMAELMPAFLRRTLGDLTLVMLSFQGMVAVGFFHPVFVLLVSLLGIYFGSEPAYDVEAGFVDLLLARPLRRQWLVTRSVALVLIGTAAPPAAMALTMPIALRVLAPANAPWPAALDVLKMAMNLTAVAAVFGALSLLIASRSSRRGSAIAGAGIVAVCCYLVMFLEPTWRPAQTFGWLLPFHYFRPLDFLAGRAAPWRDLLVLGTLAIVLTATAYWQFNRRDV
jgi:ABC-2 type transport system permease protein